MRHRYTITRMDVERSINIDLDHPLPIGIGDSLTIVDKCLGLPVGRHFAIRHVETVVNALRQPAELLRTTVHVEVEERAAAPFGYGACQIRALEPA